MPRYLSRETEPFGKWKGVPIYLTTIIVAVMIVGLIACAMIQATGSRVFLEAGFYVPRHGWANILAVFTYPFVGWLNFFTLFGIYFFYTYSVGIETHLGRNVLSRLLLMLFTVPAALATIVAYALHSPSSLIGNYYIAAGLLVAFATLYPNAEAFGFIPFKYFAAACVFLGSLMALAEREALPLIALWSSCLVGFLYIRHAVDQEYDDAIPLSARIRHFFRPKPKFRVVRKDEIPPAERWAPEPEPDAVSAEVDAILDKVARSGLDSLSSAERKKLELARQALNRRDGK